MYKIPTLRDLHSEHQSVMARLAAFEVVIEQLTKWQIGEGLSLSIWDIAANVDRICDMVASVEKSILPHFRLEEETIFPLLSVFPEEGRALRTELLREHALIRNHFAAFKELIDQQAAWDQLAATAFRIRDALVLHAQKEDNHLIPLLRRLYTLGDDEPLPPAPPGATGLI